MRWHAECWPGRTVPQCWARIKRNVYCRPGFGGSEANVEIEGKVAVVTGGGPGIGRALATALGTAGASVVVGDIDRVRAEQTAGSISAVGHQAVAHEADASAVGLLTQHGAAAYA